LAGGHDAKIFTGRVYNFIGVFARVIIQLFKEVLMETKTFEAPALYGDHHVTEVRRILQGLTGVSDVYASSAFQVIEVTFDPEKISAEEITTQLENAGYLGELPLISETGIAVEKKEGDGAFRHTATYETIKGTVSFAQNVRYTGRPLWPCPGLGPVKSSDS
jgi:copper chaperone CopZ